MSTTDDVSVTPDADQPPTAPSPDGPVLAGLVIACRPRQWAKNVLVVAAPAAAARIHEAEVAGRTLLAFLAFTLAASGTYLVNDVMDREEDARHATKRFRPVASGRVPAGLALGVGVGLLATGPLIALAAGLGELALVVGVYVAIQFAYSAGLKAIPLVDLAAVASGFVLRAVAGGVAADVRISQWFLIVTSFAALYVVANKRFAELRATGERAGTTRASLSEYSLDLLREIRLTAAAVTLAAYVLWAFENAERGGAVWFEVSIVPFVLAIYRYAMAVDAGLGEAPEDIILSDRLLLGLGVLWAAAFGGGLIAS